LDGIKKIIAWDKEFNKVRSIPHLHKDAISYLFVSHAKKLGGWKVWSGSLDRTIDITYVPDNYANKLIELDESIDEEQLEITSIQENKQIVEDNTLKNSEVTIEITESPKNLTSSRKKVLGNK